MLEKVKMALRLTTDAYDQDLASLILAAAIDLKIAGVVIPSATTIPATIPAVLEEGTDAIVERAIITYCKLHFLQMADGEFDRLKKSYDEQKAQLVTATGYTDWGEVSEA